MGLEIPAWAVGFALVILVSAVVKRGRGPFGRIPGSADHERRISDLEDSHRQLAQGSSDTSDLERRMGELEERLDFAERMLAKKNDAEPPRH